MTLFLDRLVRTLRELWKLRIAIPYWRQSVKQLISYVSLIRLSLNSLKHFISADKMS